MELFLRKSWIIDVTVFGKRDVVGLCFGLFRLKLWIAASWFFILEGGVEYFDGLSSSWLCASKELCEECCGVFGRFCWVVVNGIPVSCPVFGARVSNLGSGMGSAVS